ncbi:MAG: hypothetical protein K5896_07630, partial [Prevotella sp.]|nr:hypothetical protein [Prevotella sp.]
MRKGLSNKKADVLLKCCLAVGILCFLPFMAQAQKAKDHHFEVAKHLDIFNQVYKNLELLYVDTLNPKETIGTGIDAMLRNLDPYT